MSSFSLVYLVLGVKAVAGMNTGFFVQPHSLLFMTADIFVYHLHLFYLGDHTGGSSMSSQASSFELYREKG